jgi:site-specific recombinase XerD
MSKALTAPTPNGAQPAAAYLASLRSEVGRASMRSELNKIARILGHVVIDEQGRERGNWQHVNWTTLNAANVGAIMAKIEGAPASRNKTLACLRGVARSAWRLNLLDSETLARIEDIKGDGGTREPKGRHVDTWEVAALLKTCADDTSPAGYRDAAMIALAHGTGARREELVKLDMSDVRSTDDMIEIRVIGKRNKERPLFVVNGALDALRDWLNVRGKSAGRIFQAINKAGVIQPHGMSTTSASRMLDKRIEQAQTHSNIGAMTWHDLRRTFIGTMLDMGEDLANVAALVGHSKVDTTAGYDRRKVEARKRAARKMQTPYRRHEAKHG